MDQRLASRIAVWLHALVIGTMRLHDDVDAAVFLVLRIVSAFGFAHGLDRDIGRAGDRTSSAACVVPSIPR